VPRFDFAALAQRRTLHITTSSSIMMRRYIIARHGETNYNKERRVQGTLDSPILTTKGISQASSLGKYLVKRSNNDSSQGGEEKEITRTYCSPLQRCRQTYDLISKSYNEVRNDNDNSNNNNDDDTRLFPQPTIIDNLKEIELKEWQGRLRNDIMEQDKVNWDIFKANSCNLRLQNGTFAPVLDCFQRASECWNVIRANAASNNDDTTFVMCHGAIGQCMILHALGLEQTEYGKSRRYALDNCECFEIEWADDVKYSNRWRKIDTLQNVSDWRSTYSSQLVSGVLPSCR
jgi:probable phosphoglycerate mutase